MGKGFARFTKHDPPGYRYNSLPGSRDAYVSIGIPTAVLIGANAPRVLGVFFLILYAQGQLPAPFAPISVTISPSLTSREMPLSACIVP